MPLGVRGRTVLDTPILGPVALDSNALDPAAAGGDALLARFHALVAEAGVRVFVPLTVAGELAREGTPAALRDGLARRAFEKRRAPTAAEHIARIRVRAILRGDARPGKHDADAAHVSEAAENGCAWFITHDKRILRKRAALQAALPAGPRIATLRAFLAQVGCEDRDDDTP